jgi:hypothetical protein
VLFRFVLKKKIDKKLATRHEEAETAHAAIIASKSKKY